MAAVTSSKSGLYVGHANIETTAYVHAHLALVSSPVSPLEETCGRSDLVRPHVAAVSYCAGFA